VIFVEVFLSKPFLDALKDVFSGAHNKFLTLGLVGNIPPSAVSGKVEGRMVGLVQRVELDLSRYRKNNLPDTTFIR
jgi:hypothetical protein